MRKSHQYFRILGALFVLQTFAVVNPSPVPSPQECGPLTNCQTYSGTGVQIINRVPRQTEEDLPKRPNEFGEVPDPTAELSTETEDVTSETPVQEIFSETQKDENAPADEVPTEAPDVEVRGEDATDGGTSEADPEKVNETPTEESVSDANKLSSDNETPEMVTSEAPTEEVSSEAPAEEASSEAPTEEVTNEAPTEEVTNEAPTEEVSSEAPTEEVTVETPAQDITNEAPVEEVASETTADEVTSEAQTEEVTSEAPAQDITNEAPVEEVASEAPADEVTNEAPTEEVTSEAQTEEVTSEDPAEEVSSEAPAQDITNEAPVEEVASEALADEVTSEAQTEKVASEAPAEEVTSEAPAQGVTSDPASVMITTESPIKEVTSEAPSEEITEETRMPGNSSEESTKEDSSGTSTKDGFDEILTEVPSQAPDHLNNSTDDVFSDSIDTSLYDVDLLAGFPQTRPLEPLGETLFDSAERVGTWQLEGTDEYEQQLLRQGTSPGCVFEDREKFKRSMLATVYSKLDGDPTMLMFVKDETCVGTLSKSGRETVRSRGILLPQLPLTLQIEAGMFMHEKIYLFDSSPDQKVWGFNYNETSKIYSLKAHSVISTDLFLQACGIKAHGIRVKAIAQVSSKDPTCIAFDEIGNSHMSEGSTAEAKSLVRAIQYLKDVEYIGRIQSVFSWLDEPAPISVFVYGSNGELFELSRRNHSREPWQIGQYRRVPYEDFPLSRHQQK